MSQRKTQAEFIIEVKTKLPNLVVLGEYKNNKTRIAVECLICGNIWEPMAQSLLNGHGCQKCAGNVKMTQDEFVKRVSGTICNVEVLGTYVRSSASIKVRCTKCGYEWEPKANSLLAGHGCPKCRGLNKKTNSDFLNELKRINPKIKALTEYKNNRTQVKVKCTDCGYEWNTSPKSLLRGSECPECVRKRISITKSKSDKDFKRELSVLNPNIVVEGEYKNSKTHIEVYCKKCGYSWSATPSTLLKSKGCPICTGNNAVWKGINDLETTNPDLAKEWSYVKNAPLKPSDVRAGSTKKVWWIGDCGHEWEATIGARNSGHGCPICANNKKKTTDRFIKEMQEYNPHIEIIGKYQTALKPIRVRCKICGYEWNSKPNSLLRGTGCTNCVKKQTSFMEQFMLIAFRTALSDSLVLERNTDAIGLELDIYIPSLHLAIEPGSWLYHESKVSGIDADKRKKCSLHKIRLITIYDTYPPNTEPPFKKDCYVYEGFLNEYGFERIINLTQEIMEDYKIGYADLDWKKIADEAYLACHYNAHENFCKKLLERYPNIEVLEQYKGSNIPILVNNKACCHSAWKARPYTLLKGIGCPECARISNASSRTRTHEQFMQKLITVNPNILVLSDYKKSTQRIKVQCKVCGHLWNPYAYTLLDGRGCPHCGAVQAAKKRNNSLAVKTTEQFIKELHGVNTKIEVLGEYKNNKSKIAVRCLVCNHKWDVVPASLLHGHGCPVCARNKKTID